MVVVVVASFSFVVVAVFVAGTLREALPLLPSPSSPPPEEEAELALLLSKAVPSVGAAEAFLFFLFYRRLSEEVERGSTKRAIER